MGEPRELRQTFDGAAGTYEAARPDYPEELYRDLIDLTSLRDEATLLEIGCGSGKATRPLAGRGFRILCVELGPRLVTAARTNLRSFPHAEVVEAAFEEWESEGRRFDLIYAANSWHWIDESVRYQKAASLLEPGGHLAFWGAFHAFPAGFDPFFTEIQRVYESIGEDKEGEKWPPPLPEEVPDQSGEIEATGLFEVVGVRRYVWAQRYNADKYIALLDTFAGHLAMEDYKRRLLYAEIRKRINRRPDKQVLRHWHSILHVARYRRS